MIAKGSAAAVKVLMSRYESGSMESTLDKNKFKKMFKEAVKDYYPQLAEENDGESIYGISFEIANTVQRVYAEDFYTMVYFNTEEMYEEAVEGCEEDEQDYYRFEPWAEWDVTSARTPLFDEIQDYLTLNSLHLPSHISDYSDGLSDEALEWYEENEDEFDTAFYEDECAQIRMWIAEALGELRKEGFWAKQGNEDIYVLPFSGECEVDYEEMVETFKVMDREYHGSEYLDYLEENEE